MPLTESILFLMKLVYIFYSSIYYINKTGFNKKMLRHYFAIFFVLLLFSVNMVVGNSKIEEFTVLARNKVYMRGGPSKNYPIIYIYSQKHYPLKILSNFKAWLKVRDIDGIEGWIHMSMLSKKKFAYSIDQTVLFKYPVESSYKKAKLESGMIFEIILEETKWCKIKIEGYTGWIRKRKLWGII